MNKLNTPSEPSSAVDMDRLQETILLNLFKVSHMINRGTNRELARMGISLQVEQLQVLFVAHINSRTPYSQQDIANLLQKDKAGIQRTVKTLERDGYLRIDSDLADRRRNLITLTPAGKLVVENVIDKVFEMDRQLTSQLDPEETRVLKNVLQKIANMLES
jgi:DNA-binding MarR family transcriptional regulator